MESIRLTYVAGDSVVGINGEFYKVIMDIDTNIRAIQWYGDKGEIEFIDGSANQTIDSIDINKFISAWDLGKKKSNKPNVYSVWDDTIQDWFEDIQLKEEFEKQEKISSAKQYLKDTDYKVLPDYDKQDGVEEIKLKRQESRELIRRLEV